MKRSINYTPLVVGFLGAFLLAPAYVSAQEQLSGNPAPKLHRTEQKPRAPERATLKPAATPAPTAAAASTPASAAAAPKNETANFQGWSVACTPPGSAGQPRTCMAKTTVIKSKEDPRPIVFMNIVKADGKSTLVIQTPTGIDLAPGVMLKIGDAAPRHLNYVSCEPALCSAALPMDEALTREVADSSKASASWVGLGVGEVRVEYPLQESRNTIAYLASR
ncbi:invasion associated locus B family protein [Methylobacterium komagatae]|uniref:Invasion associated locus B family protein n=1 Tax=Methylobacterium komagatae TaxID=374425 RepID=A0ABW2BIU9_9HYPH